MMAGYRSIEVADRVVVIASLALVVAAVCAGGPSAASAEATACMTTS